MKAVILCILLLIAIPATADDQTTFRFAQYFHVAAAFADMRTTDTSLNIPGAYERNPALGSSPSDLRLYATGLLGAAAVQYYANRIRAKHPRAAPAILFATGTVHAYLAWRNHQLGD